MVGLLNRKNSRREELVPILGTNSWYQFLTAREESVPIRHGFHTKV